MSSETEVIVWEHSSESAQSARRDRIAEGRLETGAIDDLKSILDSPDLKKTPGSSELGPPRPAGEAMMTVLRIPRESRPQILYFLERFNTRGDPREIGGMSNMNYRLTDEKVLGPLQKWSKLNIDNHARISDGNAKPNDCAPVQAALSEAGSPK